LSTLGKILTVLIVVVSIAVAVLVAREFALSDNWHARYQEEARLFGKALEQRDSAIQQRDEVKRTADANKAVDQQQIETLTDELALRNNTIASLREQIENQEKRLQELAEQYAGIKDSFAKLMQERDGWRLERDDARKEADTLRTMYTELEGKWRVLLAQFADSKENLRQSDEQNKTLKGKIAWATQQYNIANWPPEAAPLPPSEKLEGLVTDVNLAAGVVQISLGSDDGVVKGMKFYVYDKAHDKYLATLTVDKVAHDSAAGQLSIIRGTVEKESHVTNRFVE
jgi:regulator of replication initiation timing